MLMVANNQFGSIYRFLNFELDLQKQELRKEGVPVRVEPQVFSLLALLVSNHNRMISKQELLDNIWNGRTVSDSAVNSRIRSARTSVGDDGKSQRLIKTIHNRGFRFAGELHDLPSRSPAGSASDRKVLPASLEAEKPEDQNDTSQVAIAVTPFAQVVADNAQTCCAEGIYDNIIVALAKLPGISIIVRRSDEERAIPANNNAPETWSGRERQNTARYVLDGSFRFAGDKVRLTAKLVDTDTGGLVWAERYDQQIRGGFEMQDDLTREIASAVQIQLCMGEQARAWASGTRNFRAWEKINASRQLCRTQCKKSILEGRVLAEQAIELDDQYGAAFHWCAYSYVSEAFGGWYEDLPAVVSTGIALARRALEIDENDAGALAVLSMLQLYGREFDDALQSAREATMMGHGNSHAYTFAAIVLLCTGQYEEAIAAVKSAIRYAPMQHAGVYMVLCTAQWLGGDARSAVATAQKSLEIDPDFFHINCILVGIYDELGQPDDAQRAAATIQRCAPGMTVSRYMRCQAYKSKATLECVLSPLRKYGVPE